MNYNQLGNIAYKDKVIRCQDCGHSFIFTSGEQAFFASKALSEPKRCKPCRELRKSTIVSDRSEASL